MIFLFCSVQKSILFFLLVEFYCNISIYYKILRNYVYYYCILNRIVWAVGTSVLFRASFTFSVLTLLFITFSSVSLSYFILVVPICECLGE